MNTPLRRNWGLVGMGAVVSVLISAAMTSAAGASAPPSATTGAPTAIAVDAATFTGAVNPAGAPTTWDVQYGPTTGYGFTSPIGNAGRGLGAVPVSVRVGGLAAATVYHFRLVAHSDEGTAYGGDASFRTAAIPPTLAKATFSAVRDTTVVVSATIVPNGLPTAWYVRFGTSTAFGSSTEPRSAGASAGAVPVAATVAKLSPNTTYDFDVVATNAAGTRVSAPQAFVTTGPPTIVSETVGALATTSATLGGSVNPDGHATSWYVQYGATTSYGSQTPIRHLGPSMSPVAVGHAIAGLVPNTAYHYRLVATSAVGTAVGSDASFTTPGPTLTSSLGAVNFGRQATLSGTVPNAAANESVAIYAQATDSSSFAQIASVLTSSGGTWAYNVAPQIGTTYKALWDGEVSPTIGIGVSPSVVLRESAPGTFFTRVAGATSFAGKIVRLQRLDHGTWRTVAFTHLNRASTAAFHPSLSGLSHLRVLLTAYQAGVGYMAATSGVHSYRH